MDWNPTDRWENWRDSSTGPSCVPLQGPVTSRMGGGMTGGWGNLEPSQNKPFFFVFFDRAVGWWWNRSLGGWLWGPGAAGVGVGGGDSIKGESALTGHTDGLSNIGILPSVCFAVAFATPAAVSWSAHNQVMPAWAEQKREGNLKLSAEGRAV